MYKNIILATDGSDHAKRASENAMHIAKCTPGSLVEIVFVVDADKVKSEVLSHWNSADLDGKRKERIREVEKMARTYEVSYKVTILQGDPGPAIVEYANNHHADIIVIGSRGLSGLQEFVLGSVSHKVAKRANCPVLIVK
ncbi:universal stress protein [Robertmurraya korlensis]|uniref:universal stress protein n=1 Tax=Robertmurraya korlensis TaxID=519977 RepID=UPI00203C156B|nr:universal stress protein [Robertmurraya korlensis]MCM3602535.1 universal stress protein [Robertmurraya korlensis]